MADEGWRRFFEDTKHKPASRLLIKAISFLETRHHALDLGSGALNDAFCLLKEGFRHVTAVDIDPVARDIVHLFPKDKFEYVICSFDKFEFATAEFDIVNAQYSLPFVSAGQFPDIWERTILSLKEGGIFTGQLFGGNDAWAGDPNMNFHPVDKVHDLLSGLTPVVFDEDEGDGTTAAGDTKHWHVYHFIARK